MYVDEMKFYWLGAELVSFMFSFLTILPGFQGGQSQGANLGFWESVQNGCILVKIEVSFMFCKVYIQHNI